jgi:CRP-like cAMP-binding protein
MQLLEQGILNYFGSIPSEDLQKITTYFQKVTIPKDSYFLKAGQQAQQLCFIESGYLRIYVETRQKEVTQWISGETSFVTELSSFLFDSPSRWHIQALQETTIYVISKTDYKNLAIHIPTWTTLEKLFIVRCFTFLEDRIFSHLSMTAEERYHFFFTHHRAMFHQVPLQHIASLLGMTPETFSRIRRKQLL